MLLLVFGPEEEEEEEAEEEEEEEAEEEEEKEEEGCDAMLCLTPESNRSRVRRLAAAAEQRLGLPTPAGSRTPEGNVGHISMWDYPF